jgi:hypothetical protein
LSRTKNENDFLVRIKTEILFFACLPVGWFVCCERNFSVARVTQNIFLSAESYFQILVKGKLSAGRKLSIVVKP